MKLQVGKIAPEFSALTDEGKKISSSSLNGKYLVLYFYPKDNTPGCTIESKEFNDLHADLVKNNAVLVGVSKDNAASHKKFRDKYGFTFDLLVDEDAKICRQFGVYAEKSMFGKKYMGINRVTFLIGPDGKILHIWEKVKLLGHAKEVLEKLITFQAAEQ